ncbi:MAG: hypothetical protein AAF456_23145 [Planctomycetota bacterium]
MSRCFSKSSFAFFLALGFALASGSHGQTLYSVVDLGDLPGGSASRAFAINDNGEICGTSTVSNSTRGFFWSESAGMIDIGSPGSGFQIVAQDINNGGVIAGYGDSVNETVGFVWDPVNGSQNVGTLSGSNRTFLRGINDAGVATGRSNGEGITWDTVNGLQTTGHLGSGAADNQAINELGQIAGASFDPSFNLHAYTWDSQNGATDIGALIGKNSVSYANDINNFGVVAGSFLNPTSESVSYVWDPATGLDLPGAVPGAPGDSQANAINDSGQVVGAGGSVAFIYKPGTGVRDLNNLLDSSGDLWTLSTALDINERGQIVGIGDAPDGTVSAFLLNPANTFADTIQVTRGTVRAGSLNDLIASDDNDLSVSRNPVDVQPTISIEFCTQSFISSPDDLTFTLESSVFARANISQEIELFDFSSQQWEQVDMRNASRFGDLTVTVDTSGNVSRFVEAGSRAMKARVTFNSAQPRARFSANIDRVEWNF